MREKKVSPPPPLPAREIIIQDLVVNEDPAAVQTLDSRFGLWDHPLVFT